MSKKTLQVLSIIEIILALAAYLLLRFEYSTNAHILAISAKNTAEAKIYCICLYVIPAIHLIAGLLASIFNEAKKLMVFASCLVLVSSLLHIFVVIGEYSLLRALVTIAFGLIYLIAAVTLPKKETK